LGNDFKDGLQLNGTRETRTYRSGSIGNDQPVVITTEYWYAPGLHLNISVKRTDPRFGIQTVHLTELRREEPDVTLFEVPAEYKLINENGSPQNTGSAGGSAPTRVRMGGNVQAARIINRVQPEYPEAARNGRISGTVRLHVIIGKDGTIQQLEVMSGHPMLQQAALDAVRQWRYQPTLLNGEPVEVDTTIDVIFALTVPQKSP
jgi:TonB family protein